MLLVVDVGNSSTAIGLIAEQRAARNWRVSTVRERTSDEWALLLRGLLASDPYELTGAALSSVVPEAAHAVRRALEEMVDGPIVVVGPGTRTGMALHTDNPREVGADRVVNAVAAADRYGYPVVVVDFGTATTLDVVGPDGDYLGGVIAPGLEVSMDALAGHTAALRRVEMTPPPGPIGRNTVTAIQSGLLFGHAGMVDRLVEMISEELGTNPPVVATGGLAATVAPLCHTAVVVDEFLTLEGLRLVFERNSST